MKSGCVESGPKRRAWDRAWRAVPGVQIVECGAKSEKEKRKINIRHPVAVFRAHFFCAVPTI